VDIGIGLPGHAPWSDGGVLVEWARRAERRVRRVERERPAGLDDARAADRTGCGGRRDFSHPAADERAAGAAARRPCAVRRGGHHAGPAGRRRATAARPGARTA